MMRLRKMAMSLLTALALVGLGACEGLPGQLPGARTAELPPDGGLILFATDAVGTQAKRRVQYADNEQRVEYALYQGGGAQAEFVYMETPYTLWVAFEFPYTIRDKVETWKFSKGQAIAWQPASLVRTALGQVFIRPYQLTAMDRSCFGMSGEWDTAVQDPRLRPERIMFGYYCAPPGQALSDPAALTLLDNIGIKGMTVRSRRYADRIHDFYGDVVANFGGSGKGAKAIELAQGRAVAEATGIEEFPFDYAEYYNPGGGPSDLVN